MPKKHEQLYVFHCSVTIDSIFLTGCLCWIMVNNMQICKDVGVLSYTKWCNAYKVWLTHVR